MKIAKKPKGDDDIFGLNSLLGLSEVNSHPNTNDDVEDLDCPIDLNNHPSIQFVPQDHGSDAMEDVGNVDGGDVLLVQAVEIEATKILGDKLGANLHAHDTLIKDSIIQEGLQLGKL